MIFTTREALNVNVSQRMELGGVRDLFIRYFAMPSL
jgi:hypothetical protein